MATTSTSVLGFMDFIFASDLIGEGENYLVSDAENGEDLQFQEDLLSSAITSQLIINIIPELLETTNEAGESSQSFCEICLERKDKDQMFTIGSCFHSFCSDCISQHVITRIQQSRTTITCPEVNCKSVLELDAFRPLLAKEVIIRWKDALCEEFIRPLPKFYCPFEDCSAMFVVDSEGGDIRQSECQFCHRMFCAKCRVPWHPGVGCEEYKELNQRNRDDLMLRKLAKEKNWGWCPQCKVYVERTDGCPHMTCRCKFQFCYRCGEEWTKDHGGCERN